MAQVAVGARNGLGRAWERVRAAVARAVRGLRRGYRLDRVLASLAVLLLPAGVTAIVLGWAGAARTPFLFEQVPYLISGGLLGVGMLTAGGLLYLASWIARSSQQAGARDEAIRDLLTDLRDELRAGALDRSAAAAVAATPPARPGAGTSLAYEAGAHATEPVAVVAPFVATPSGTMYHREACAVVRDRADLRRVAAAEGLRACALCEPDG